MVTLHIAILGNPEDTKELKQCLDNLQKKKLLERKRNSQFFKQALERTQACQDFDTVSELKNLITRSLVPESQPPFTSFLSKTYFWREAKDSKKVYSPKKSFSVPFGRRRIKRRL